MADLSAAISQMGVLFLIVVLGFVLTKVGYLDQSVSSRFTTLLVNVTLPCMIISSVSEMDFASAQSQIPQTVALACILLIAMIPLGVLIAMLVRARRFERSVYLIMSLCSNVGFMGIPVVSSILGDHSIVLSSIYVVLQGVLVYSVGFMTLAATGEEARIEEGLGKRTTSDDESGSASGQSTKRKLRIPWRSMFNPAMFASLLALALFFGQVRLPYVLNEAMSMVGDITAPIAMMVVGILLTTVKFREIFTDWRIYVFVILRFLVGPLVVFFAVRYFVSDPLVVGVAVLLFAMPSGTMTPLFCSQFGHDAVLPTKGLIVSTLSAFIFIPILLIIMTYCA